MKIVNLAEERVRRPVLSFEKENMVGLEESIQVSMPNIKIDSKGDSSNKCLDDDQSQNTTSNEEAMLV